MAIPLNIRVVNSVLFWFPFWIIIISSYLFQANAFHIAQSCLIPFFN